MLEVPESLAAERRRTGADRWDEVWEGVLHMVPAPSNWHQFFEGELHGELRPIARRRGLVCAPGTNLGTPQDYRVPDLVVAAPGFFSQPGIVSGAQLVVEVLSPNDESYEKLPFYASLGVLEALYVEPVSRVVELFVLRGEKLLPLSPDETGAVRSTVLGVSFLRVEGPKLRLAWDGGAAEI